jgi:hypothetical protein
VHKVKFTFLESAPWDESFDTHIGLFHEEKKIPALYTYSEILSFCVPYTLNSQKTAQNFEKRI